MRDHFGGYSVAVNQLEWGHVANKWTWLYIVGVNMGTVYESIDGGRSHPGKSPTHDMTGARGRNSGNRGRGLKECSAGLRRRTPIAFAIWLLELAAQAKTRKPLPSEFF
jgi:hypothetical protein